MSLFTGGTAALAGRVTSWRNARAARVQAEVSARAQQRNQLRVSRRTAYLELIDQAHVIGELYWRLGDVYAQSPDADARLKGIEALRVALRDAFDPLQRCARVAVLESPGEVAQEAERVLDAARRANMAVYEITQGDDKARERFNKAHHDYRHQLETFIDTARTAMNE